MTASSAPAASLLKRQLKEMQAGKDIPGISCGLVNDNNIFEWEVMLMISDDCKYYGGKIMFSNLSQPFTTLSDANLCVLLGGNFRARLS